MRQYLSTPHHPRSRRKAKVGVALAIGMGLLAVPVALPTSAAPVTASAESSLQAVSTAGYDEFDPAALLAFDANVGLVLRRPEISATEAEAEARTAAEPNAKLTCHEGANSTAPAAVTATTTFTGTGVYGSEDGMLVQYFYMDEVPTSALDLCTMSGSSLLRSSGDSHFVFSAAGAKAAYGDPARLEAAAKATLTTIKTAAAKIYKKAGAFAGANVLRTQLRSTLKTDNLFIRPTGADIPAENIPYLERVSTDAQAMTAAIRMSDTRLVTMTYNGKSKKTTFKVTPKAFANPAAPSTKAASVSKQAPRAASTTSKYYLPGRTTRLTGVLGVGTTGGSAAYVAISTTVGTLSLESSASRDKLTLPFGYSSFSGQQIAMRGTGSDIVLALRQGLTLTTPNIAVKPGDASQNAVISVTAFDDREGLAYNPANQHFYQFVRYPAGTVNADKTAVKATAAAEASKEMGVSGYLATITSSDENDFVSSKIEGASNVWINGSDSETENAWKFTSGPEKGQNFWNGCGAEATPAGSAPAGAFARWNTPDKEPNNYQAAGDTCEQAGQAGKQAGVGEDCMVTNWSRPWIAAAYRIGYWNDLGCDSATDSAAVQGYVVEYGEKSVGGQFTGVAVASATLMPTKPAAKAIAPNFFRKVASFFKAPAKRIFLPKKPNQPKTFTVKYTVQIAEPGIYIFAVKSKTANKGYKLYRETKLTVKGSANVRKVQQNYAYFMQVVVTKKNQKITFEPILDARMTKKKDVALVVRSVSELRASATPTLCVLGFCNSQGVPKK